MPVVCSRRRLLAAVALLAAGAAPPPEPESADRLRRGLSREEVRQLLGPPARVARQILYQRHLEQWIYDRPRPLRLEFDCPRGRESQLTSIGPFQPGRP
jgi:hypothetical protein